MITPKEIEKKTMNPEKREKAKKDIFGFYVGRPITYILTVPFLYTNISPNIVSYISFIPIILGFILLAVGKTKMTLSLGWLGFFLWSMLDGVDGNIARYKKQYSKIGDTLDAAAGYFAMALIFFGAGITAAHDMSGIVRNFVIVSGELYIILGGLSGMCMIIPRLIMHKAMTSTGSKDIGRMKDRAYYSFAKVIALNITSIPGLVQILLIVGIFTHTLDLYTIGYFFINILIMLISLRSIFKG
ncbi:CDP-alcohol phosphatidyltransferase family protein [Enterocloster citroniae]|uniref:CDP-alcohol phosphatidyltransferase family protein n=1 Tax=Enterocloster citroniae TaxID=358743 RepID=UPI00349EB94C